ncbi:MAG: membrane protein insertase YidC, partial [Bdellovibrionales bacterium]|nr:membrane protein insertase YidC [Bdellovibrionales bacterium]
MEDKRTGLAIVLCILVVMVYSELFIAPYTRPPQQVSQGEAQVPKSNKENVEIPVMEPVSGTPAQVAAQVSEPVTQVKSEQHLPPPGIEEINNSGLITIDSANFKAVLSKLGGRLLHFELKNYFEHLDSDQRHDLIMKREGAALPLGLYTSKWNDARVSYALTEVSTPPVGENSYQLLPGQSLALTFEGKTPDQDNSIKKIFRFHSDSYLFDLNVNLAKPNGDGSPVWLEWTQFVPTAHVTNRYNPEGFTFLHSDNSRQTVLISDVENTMENAGSNIWLSYAEKYFMVALIPGTAQQNSTYGGVAVDGELESDSQFPKGHLYYLRAKGAPQISNFSVFAGPKVYRTLKQSGFQLERSIDLGVFSFLAFPLLAAIHFFYGIFGNYGLAIILLTLLIKTIFLPLNAASMKNMRAMQELQPEMKALRERIKDPTQLNQEMAALFKRRGVNPMGGCFPMLIQIPVFLGLYSGLLNSIELRHAPFALWIRDLSAPEYLHVAGLSIPVMVLLMGASMFIQMKTSPQSPDPVQQKVALAMPIIFTAIFIVVPMPAGLVLYWLVNNLISITQSVYL